ncbi:hypothetical protein NCT71_004310 [Escherichia coli]|nr:hypothetical protein [Escherichia coli]
MAIELPAYEKHYSTEERILANHLIALEKAALDKWFKGDTSGYKSLWSSRIYLF